MKNKFWYLPIFILPALFFFLDFAKSEAESTNQSYEKKFIVQKDPSKKDIQRIGLNLGGQTNWGSEIFLNNILLNPGFEPSIARFIVFVSRSDENSFSNDGWEHPDHQWKGATYDIRTGPAKGKKGVIKDSLKSGEGGQPQFFVDEILPPLEPHDVIVLTKEIEPDVLPFGNWWYLFNAKEGISPSSTVRPGSPGVQSVLMEAKPYDIMGMVSYVDHLGKFLALRGKWKLSFWAKGEGEKALLNVFVHRMKEGGTIFSQQIPLTPEWQEYSFSFDVNEEGPQEAKLALEFNLNPSPNGKAWLDDVFFGNVDAVPETAFRKEVVSLLEQLRPSYLRDWQMQNSDSIPNRLALPYARKNQGVSPDGGGGNVSWLYSLPEFLDLCQKLQANPWIVIPTVGSDEEYLQLGKFLSQAATTKRFSDVILEFGNENWNWIFRPAGIPYPEQNGKVAEAAFKLIKSVAGKDVHLRTAIGGQHQYPYWTLQYANNAPSVDIIAVASYFFGDLNERTSQHDALKLLFAPDPGFLKDTLNEIAPSNRPIASYEINMHTTHGTATEEERNELVAAMVSGSALAKHLLENISLGIQPSMVFTFSQFDTSTDNHQSVKLWGITRDLSPTLLFRPTGLAVKMLNSILGGNYHSVQMNSSALIWTVAAFSGPQIWHGVVVSENSLPEIIEIEFPQDEKEIPKTMQVLEAKSPFDTNEDEELVKIVEKPLEVNGRTVKLMVPAFGLIVF